MHLVGLFIQLIKCTVRTKTETKVIPLLKSASLSKKQYNIQLIKLNIHLGALRTARVYSTVTLKNRSLMHKGKQVSSMSQRNLNESALCFCTLIPEKHTIHHHPYYLLYNVYYIQLFIKIYTRYIGL